MIDNRRKNGKRSLLSHLPGVAIIIGVLYSCASIGRIEGGPYDETPPRFLSGTPSPGALNVKKPKITLEFDEYIKLDKPGEKIVFSPPQRQQPEVKNNGKKVVITLRDTLLADATYTIDFGDAIQDNNEGNPLENFTYSFSTGSQLDTMAVSGTVLNAFNLEPIKGMQVGLHSELSDTAFTSMPFYRVGRTDSRGHFSIRGVAPGSYRLFALQDMDQNNFYSQPSEALAFDDSIVVPRMERRMRQDTTWIDTLTIDTIRSVEYTHFLPDDLLLRSFKELVYQHRQVRAERQQPHKFTLFFTAPADTFPVLKGLNFDDRDAFVVEDLTGRRDTLDYWICDTLLHQQDSLRFSLTYLFTDSLNQVVPRTDTLTVVPRQTWAKLKKQEQEAAEKAQKEREKRKKKKGEVEATEVKHLEMETYAPASMDVYDYIYFSFKEPIRYFDDTYIHLYHKVDTLWEAHPYVFSHDSIDIKRFNVTADWEPGESYKLEVDSAAVTGLYGLTSDKVKKEFKARKLDEYGQIFFNVVGAPKSAFVELLDTSDKPVRAVELTDGKADFYFLNPGKYGARLIEDPNGNGLWDTGSYAEKRQPEKVHYYFQVIELKANFDLTQDWNLLELSPEKQKPLELKKQKPDEKKKRDRNNNRNGYGNNRLGGNRNSGRGYGY